VYLVPPGERLLALGGSEFLCTREVGLVVRPGESLGLSEAQVKLPLIFCLSLF
jgi:hypothetical protein